MENSSQPTKPGAAGSESAWSAVTGCVIGALCVAGLEAAHKWLVPLEEPVPLFLLAIILCSSFGSAMSGLCALAGGLVAWGVISFVPELGFAQPLLTLHHAFIALIVSPPVLACMSRLRAQYETAHRTLAQVAAHDPLTGLANRRLFVTSCEKELDRSLRGAIPLTIAVLEVDGFGALMSKHGTKLCDQVMLKIAQTLDAAMRNYDVVARTDKGQFAIMVIGASTQQVEDCLWRVRAAIQQLTFDVPNVGVTVTTGLSVVDLLSADAIEEALARAGSALTAAKATGPNRIRWHEATIQGENLMTDAELRP